MIISELAVAAVLRQEADSAPATQKQGPSANAGTTSSCGKLYLHKWRNGEKDNLPSNVADKDF
jgi:hypothetical protein